jgi:hypothetical protein
VGDERSRLHEIVDQLPEHELALACQLLELLARGGDAHPAATSNGHDDDEEPGPQEASPATIARLAQLTDTELLHLDEMLDSDPGAARIFWRERFGEELPDHELGGDGRVDGAVDGAVDEGVNGGG